MRTLGMATALLTICILLGCSPGGGGPLIDPNSGRITGKISFDGPHDATTPLGVALFLAGTQQEVEKVAIGKAGSAIQANIEGAGIRYLLTNLFIGSYELVVYKDDGVNPRENVFRSTPVSPGLNGQTATFDTHFSFTGPTPHGTAAGTVAVTGTWPAGRKVFIGVEPAAQPGTVLRWPVAETDLVGGNLAFTVPSLAIGSYKLGLYSVTSAGAVTNHGSAAANTVLTAAAPNQTGQDFAATF